MAKDPLSPTMHKAIGHALEHGKGVIDAAILVRFPGGFWSHREWRSDGPNWGTTTIEAIVKRGAGEYIKFQTRKDGSQFPIEVRITL